MNRFFLYGLASIALASSAASAQVTGSLGGGFGPFLDLSNAGLSGGSIATLTGGTVLASDQPFADIPFGAVYGPAFLSAGPSTGSTATLNFTAPINYLSFLWGSPDTYNLLTFTTNLGNVSQFTAPGMGFPVTNGDQSFSQYVQFSAVGTQTISSVSFTNVPSTDAFETANFSVAAAVPEPSSWAMMLIGFGGIGYSMRRRRKTMPIAQLA